MSAPAVRLPMLPCHVWRYVAAFGEMRSVAALGGLSRAMRESGQALRASPWQGRSMGSLAARRPEWGACLGGRTLGKFD